MNGKRYDRDLVLDRWAEGWTPRQIAAEQGMSPYGSFVDHIVLDARRRGDPRAAKRRPPRATGTSTPSPPGPGR